MNNFGLFIFASLFHSVSFSQLSSMFVLSFCCPTSGWDAALCSGGGGGGLVVIFGCILCTSNKDDEARFEQVKQILMMINERRLSSSITNSLSFLAGMYNLMKNDSTNRYTVAACPVIVQLEH
ncbi:hypothetical protein T4D_552 [Trichinella pseudospiralis]|uniref:Uncharacterized protein n=1 Tax=Trichinella pseudospiralis TaxID=6337 RepID=A0A0V1FIW6_TRIPS|nr:hypothetical protein T4D_552 [Trichinella pseudospiralis]